MDPNFILLIAVFATVLALFVLWLYLIAPRARKKAVKPFLRPYAHRGLWSASLPENSLSAFRAAAAHGFAIELDVQLSRDGVVMVFHDYTLERMCGREERLGDLTAEELRRIPLKGGKNDFIPTLSEVLAVVDGRVPLLIELKGENTNTALVPAMLSTMSEYKGLWCVESFNPFLLCAVKKQAPHVVRGLLSTNLIKDKQKGSFFRNFALSALLLTFLCRPAFHAWNGKYPRRLALRTGIRLFGAASFVYTVKSEEEALQFMQKGICPIFDGFAPKKLH